MKVTVIIHKVIDSVDSAEWHCADTGCSIRELTGGLEFVELGMRIGRFGSAPAPLDACPVVMAATSRVPFSSPR